MYIIYTIYAFLCKVPIGSPLVGPYMQISSPYTDRFEQNYSGIMQSQTRKRALPTVSIVFLSGEATRETRLRILLGILTSDAPVKRPDFFKHVDRSNRVCHVACRAHVETVGSESNENQRLVTRPNHSMHGICLYVYVRADGSDMDGSMSRTLVQSQASLVSGNFLYGFQMALAPGDVLDKWGSIYKPPNLG